MSNEELMAFLRKNSIVVACVAMIAAISFVLYYRSDKLPEAEKVLNEKTQQGQLLQANKEDANQLKEQYAALVADNEAIASRMIHAGQLADNMQYFYKLESETNTKLSDPRQNAVVLAKNAPKTTFIPVGFSLTAQGDYPQLIDLLRRVENGEHYSRIITCNLKPVTEIRGGPLVMSVSLELLGTQSE